MPAIALHPQQRVEGRFEAIDDAGDAEIAEVVGAERGQELQPDVGGRRAMRDDVGAVLLIVVGDEPVVGRRQQLFEEPPGLSCGAAQCGALFAVERRMAMLERQPGGVGEQRRQEPQRQDWRRQQQPARRRHRHHLSGHAGEHRRHPHPLEDPAKRRRHDRSIGGDPLQQVAPGDQHPDHRPDDRIEHHRALMRQHDQRQRRLAKAAENVVALGADVLPQRHPGQAVRHRTPELRVRGERDDHQRQRGPQRRRPREDGPGGDEQHDQRRRDQAAPQVVEDLPARDRRQPVGARRHRWRRGPCARSSARSASRRGPSGAGGRRSSDSGAGSRR